MAGNDTITSVLAADHAAVRRLIAQVIVKPDLAPSLYPQIADALRRHSKAEEQTLYDALASFPVELAQMQRSWQEHEQLGALLGDLDGMPYSDPRFMPTFLQMNHALEGHLAVEETQVFDFARRMLPSPRQIALGKRYEAKMGRGLTKNISILLPALSPARQRKANCGCRKNPCGCARKPNPIPWFHHFVGVIPFMRRRLAR